MASLLTDLYDNCSRHSDIAFVIGDQSDNVKQTFDFNSLVLKNYCPDLLKFCQTNGFNQSNATHALVQFEQADVPMVVTKWTMQITDEKISSDLMSQLQRHVYQVELLDTQMKKDQGDIVYMLRFFSLNQLRIKYFKLNDNIRIADAFDPNNPFYPDRMCLFLSKKHISVETWENIVWSLTPSNLLSVLESNEFRIPSEYDEDKLGRRLGAYLKKNDSSVPYPIKKQLILTLNTRAFSAAFITEELSDICADPTILFELLQQPNKAKRGVLDGTYAVSALSTVPEKYKLVDVEHFEQNKEAIKQLCLGGKIHLVEQNYHCTMDNPKIIIKDAGNKYVIRLNGQTVWCSQHKYESVSNYVQLRSMTNGDFSLREKWTDKCELFLYYCTD